MPASQAASRFLLITGSARSGTSMLGNLIASCEFVEYKYEPSLMAVLYALIDSIPECEWKLLHDAYLFEEILVGALSGRGLNTNIADESSVYRYMDKQKVGQRLQASLSRSDVCSALSLNRPVIAYKMPDIVPYLPRVSQMYPNSSTVVMRRRLLPTLHSLLKKQWFSKGVKGDQSSQIFPFSEFFMEPERAVNVPYWVSASDFEWWAHATELDRAVYYYFANTPDDKDSCCIVDYELLLENPASYFNQLIDDIGLDPGPLTQDLLATVKPRESTLSDEDVLAELSKVDLSIARLPYGLRERAERLNFSY